MHHPNKVVRLRQLSNRLYVMNPEEKSKIILKEGYNKKVNTKEKFQLEHFLVEFLKGICLRDSRSRPRCPGNIFRHWEQRPLMNLRR